LLLDRLEWLAPAQVGKVRAQDKNTMLTSMQTYFATTNTPLMLALLEDRQDDLNVMREYRRGMVVPDDWFEQADAAQLKRAPQ